MVSNPSLSGFNCPLAEDGILSAQVALNARAWVHRQENSSLMTNATCGPPRRHFTVQTGCGRLSQTSAGAILEVSHGERPASGPPIAGGSARGQQRELGGFEYPARSPQSVKTCKIF